MVHVLVMVVVVVMIVNTVTVVKYDLKRSGGMFVRHVIVDVELNLIQQAITAVK